LVPGAWVAGEYLRAWPGLGGPWGLLGASQWNQPAVLSLASVAGVWAVSFLLVAVNLGLAVALAGPPGVRLAALGVPLLLLAGTLAYAAARPAPGAAGTVRVGLVQPGVIDQAEARFRASEAATPGLAGGRPDLVVWGESSVGRDPDRADLARLAAAARA